MKLKKGQSRVPLPPYSKIVQVAAREKGDTVPYRLVPMSLGEIERMRKQEPVPYKKPIYYAEVPGGLEIVAAARMQMDVTVTFYPPEERV